jgi:hypothetical protein
MKWFIKLQDDFSEASDEEIEALAAAIWGQFVSGDE